MSMYDATAASRLLEWDLDEDEDFVPNDDYVQLEEWETCPELSWDWRFKFIQYDWDDIGFIRKNHGEHAYRTIPLTQGYFMIVSPHDYRRMTRFPDGSPKRWTANVQRHPRTGEITKVYAYRHGRADEPTTVYAHRELVGCLEDPGVVDHKNGWGLDNRRGTQARPVNLRYTSQSENLHNALRSRSTNLSLPRGVEPRKKNRRGLQMYGGMYCKRSGEKVRTVRSKRLWLTPEPAGRWYESQMRKLHRKRTAWAHNPESVSYPVFPPAFADDIPF